MALPGLLDAEGGFRLMGKCRAIAPQFGGAAQHAVDKEAVHHDPDLVGGRRVPRDELIRHRAGKAPVPAVVIKAEQVVSIGVGFAIPQFADDAAVGQGFVHLFRSPEHQFAALDKRDSPAPNHMVQCSKIATVPAGAGPSPPINAWLTGTYRGLCATCVGAYILTLMARFTDDR